MQNVQPFGDTLEYENMTKKNLLKAETEEIEAKSKAIKQWVTESQTSDKTGLQILPVYLKSDVVCYRRVNEIAEKISLEKIEEGKYKLQFVLPSTSNALVFFE